MIRSILALCSRDRGHDEIYEKLLEYLGIFESLKLSWEELVDEAELQGIAPLVFKHLTASGYKLPLHAKRPLHSLSLRHKHSNAIRNEIVADLLVSLRSEGLDCLLLKGIYLSNSVYEEMGDRPMRDIDILVDETHAEDVRKLLLDSGFDNRTHPEIDEDHHHLNPLVKNVDGVTMSIEVHRHLLPKQLQERRWTYTSLNTTAMRFIVGGEGAFTLDLENTLHYLYLHGFCLPLTYEPFRLIHVADLVSLVELEYQKIDWAKLKTVFPEVYGILSRLHFLTPYHPKVVNTLPLNLGNIPSHAGIAYSGWPLRLLKDVPARELLSFANKSIWPPQWWVQMHYGQIEGLPYLKTRFFEHPRTLWRWVKTFWKR